MAEVYPSTETKVCVACEIAKPLSEFYRATDRRYASRKTERRVSERRYNGHRARCKACYKASKSRSSVARQDERRRAAEKQGKQYRTKQEWAAAGNESREQLRSILEARRAERMERRRWLSTPQGKLWLQQQKKLKTRRQHLRRVATLQSGKGSTRERRFRLYQERHDGSLTLEVVEALYGEATHCAYCCTELDELNRTLDHIVPIERGGLHGISNLVAACRSCNTSKGAKLLDEWQGPPQLV